MPGQVRFTRAPLEEAAERLAAILRTERADLLISYDANGGYGHRDHVRVHEVGARAAVIAGTPRVLEATVPTARWTDLAPPPRATLDFFTASQARAASTSEAQRASSACRSVKVEFHKT